MEKMMFNSLKEAKKYIADKLPGGQYTIYKIYSSLYKAEFAIVDENIAALRQKKAAKNNLICSKTPYLRINGEII